jgi:DNA repair protein RadC
MKKFERTCNFKPAIQRSLLFPPSNRSTGNFVSIYRVSLVKDGNVSFGDERLSCSQQAHFLIQNHPSNDLQPSSDDITVTRRIIQAAEIMGIRVHEHIIINMENNGYFSFADSGIIHQLYSEIK